MMRLSNTTPYLRWEHGFPSPWMLWLISEVGSYGSTATMATTHLRLARCAADRPNATLQRSLTALVCNGLPRPDGLHSMSRVYVPRFPFACSHTDQLFGWANGTRGMIGLSRTLIGLPIQLSLKSKAHNKLTLCLPSKKYGYGALFIGSVPYFVPPYTKDASNLLIRTPLIINPVSTAPVYPQSRDHSDEYCIDVKSNIDGKFVSSSTSMLSIDRDEVGGTTISTITPYTVLHSAIYKDLIRDFVKKAAANKKMKRVGLRR
ncbi:hypothetical protein ACOSQ2_007847 [Xanthoceras sorbifolium]